jgi:hypothetical protein
VFPCVKKKKKADAIIEVLGAVMPAIADAGLNPDDRG